MADANVSAVQNAVNRYAGPAGFTKIGVDGIVGNDTGQGVLKALEWIQSNSPDDADTAAGLAAAIAPDFSQINRSAPGLSEYLNGVADQQGLSRVNPPLVASGKLYPSAIPGLPGSPAAASLSQTWQKMPTWAKVSVGIAAGLGAIATYKHVKKRHKTLSGFFGL